MVVLHHKRRDVPIIGLRHFSLLLQASQYMCFKEGIIVKGKKTGDKQVFRSHPKNLTQFLKMFEWSWLC